VPTFSWSSTNIGPGAYAYVRQAQEIALNYASGRSSISSATPIVSHNCTIAGLSHAWCYVVGVVYVGGTAHLDVTTLQSVGTFGSIYPPLDISTNVAGQPAVSGAYKDVAVVYAEPPLYNVTIYRYHTNLMDVLSLYGPQVVAIWRGENQMYYSNPLANSPYFYFVKVGPVYAANGVISAMPNIEVLQAVQSIDREQVMVLLTKPPPTLYAPSTS